MGVVDEYGHDVFVQQALLGELFGALEVCDDLEEAALQF